MNGKFRVFNDHIFEIPIHDYLMDTLVVFSAILKCNENEKPRDHQMMFAIFPND